MLKLCNASKQDRSACKQWSCLTKDLLRVVDPLNSMKISSSSPTSQLFTVRHLETILHMNKCRDTNWRSSSPVDSTVGWRSSDCWQLHFESSTTLLFTVTHYSLSELYSPTSLKSTSLKVTLSPKMFSKLRSQFTLTFLLTSVQLISLSNPVPWQNWMAAYLSYTLRLKMLFRGWPVMVNVTHTRRRRLANVMTSSINLDADWSVVSQLPDTANTFIVQYLNMNGRQLSIFSKSIMNGCSITLTAL